jgi:hypothetical protein
VRKARKVNKANKVQLALKG